MRISLLALVCGLSVLAGCSTAKAPVSFYQLSSQSTSAVLTATPVVLVKELTLADYLKTDTLIQRVSATQVLAGEARWTTSLDQALNEKLLSQLGQELKSQSIFTQAPALFDIAVELKVNRLDSGPKEPAVIEARWQLTNAKGEALASRMLNLTEAHDGSLDDQVRAQSALLTRLSQALAVHIEENLEPAKAPVVQTPVVPAPKPERPTVKPARSVEVFRF